MISIEVGLQFQTFQSIGWFFSLPDTQVNERSLMSFKRVSYLGFQRLKIDSFRKRQITHRVVCTTTSRRFRSFTLAMGCESERDKRSLILLKLWFPKLHQVEIAVQTSTATKHLTNSCNSVPKLSQLITLKFLLFS